MSNLSVLIVDDSLDFAKGLKRIFESFNWSANIASDLNEAKSLFTSDEFDLVIVDCFIPDTDGFSISKELSVINNDSTSIFFLMSGILTDDASTKEALSYSHISDFIKKPINTEVLKAKLAEHFPAKRPTVVDLFLSQNPNLSAVTEHFNVPTSLNKFELTFFIKLLSELEYSGEINFTNNNDKTTLIFNIGAITSIYSPSFEDSMGELLVGLGYLTRANLSSYINSDDFKNSGRRIGEALIFENYISPHAVPVALTEQKRIRLHKLLNSTDSIEFEMKSLPHFEHDPSISLNTNQITDCLIYFMSNLDSKNFTDNLLQSFENLQAQINTLPTYDACSKLEVDKDSLVSKYNSSARLNSEETRSFLTLSLCRDFEFYQNTESLSSKSNEKSGLKEHLRKVSKRLKSGDSYHILGLNIQNITDQKVSKKYQMLAKELHPDKLSKSLDSDELENAKNIFAEITKAFNNIKTDENRRTYESQKANQKAQEQMDCSISLEKAKKALGKGSYTEALRFLDTPKMHENQPNEFGLHILWASLKSKDSTIEISAEKILENEHRKLSNEPLYYYLKALIANKNSDMQSFFKFINLSLKADPHFLPARRESQIVRSQQTEPKKEKSSWFGFKKSS